MAKTRRVRLKSTFAHPSGATGQEGDVLELPSDLAKQLLEADPPAAEEAPEPAGEPPPGTLTQAGSFGGTPAGLDTSGQTPGIAAPAPDPLLSPEAHADGLAVGTDAATVPEAEPVLNREAIAEEAAPEEKETTGRRKKH